MSIDTLAACKFQGFFWRIFDVPTDHPRGKRACLPHCVDTTSHVDQFLQAFNMHFADFCVAFAKLRNTYDQLRIQTRN
jgi:hypothetical protein